MDEPQDVYYSISGRPFYTSKALGFVRKVVGIALVAGLGFLAAYCSDRLPQIPDCSEHYKSPEQVEQPRQESGDWDLEGVVRLRTYRLEIDE